MTYIQRFSVSGLAGRDETIEHVLDRHVNVMWGLNGSGKTSLLRILHSALENDASALARIPFRSAEVHFFSDNFGGTFVRKINMSEDVDADFLDIDPDMLDPDIEHFVEIAPGEYDFISYGGERRWQTSAINITRPNRIPGRFVHTYLPISRVAESRPAPAASGRVPRTTMAREAVSDALFDSMFADQVRKRWSIYNARALGEIREVQQQGLAEILSLLFGGDSHADTAADPPAAASLAYSMVAQFLARQNIHLNIGRKAFETRYKREASLQQVVRRIETVLRSIDKALAPQRELQSLIGELYSGSKTLDYDERGGLAVRAGKHLVALESLSSGEKQLLQILLETLASNNNAIIIDEPELSMHVDWQNRLVHAMRTVNPECQLILATHSPEIMADVSEDKIFEL